MAVQARAVKHERWRREPGPALLAQLDLVLVIESCHVGTRRPDPERERLPPLLERRMLDAHPDSSLVDVDEADLVEQALQLSLTRADSQRLPRDPGIERPGRVPQGAQRPLAAAVIPHAGDNSAARTGHACHLPHTRRRVAHELDDELREGRVERVVRKRQLLRGAQPDVDAGVACRGRPRRTAPTDRSPRPTRRRRGRRAPP